MFYVYVLEDQTTGAIYIGSTRNVNQRYRRHMIDLLNHRHHSALMQKTYDDGGEIVISEIFELRTREQAYQLEDDLIKSNTDDGMLLNVALDSKFGDCTTHNPNRDEIIQRRNTSLKKTLASFSQEERNEKYGRPGAENGMFGRHHTPEALHKMSIARTGRPCPTKGIPMSPERYKLHMEAMARRDITGERNGFYGKHHTQETIDKLRRASIGNIPSNILAVNINGQTYISMTDAARKTGVPLPTVRWRCLSKNPKFAEWKLL